MEIRDCGHFVNWCREPHCRRSVCKDLCRGSKALSLKPPCFQLSTLFFLHARNLVLQAVDLGVLLLDRIIKVLIQGMFFVSTSPLKLSLSRGALALQFSTIVMDTSKLFLLRCEKTLRSYDTSR